MKKNGEQKMTKGPLKFLMATVFLLFICFNSYAQETKQFDSEAKKLEFIRQMLAKEKYLRLSQYSAPHCKQMMTDLSANKNFKAIEPDVRADSEDDPRMAKWRQCEDYGLGGEIVFKSLNLLGAPPYRYYKMELDGNKENGSEDMIYYNMPSDRTKPGRTGYAWIDLKHCRIKNVFTIIGALETWSTKPNAVYLNTLVYYKGKLWAAEFVDGHGFALFHWPDPKPIGIETCQWFIFESMEKEKEFYNRHPPVKTNSK